MTVGDRIKQRRQELGISVDELAAKLGKNRATVYRYESNDIEDLPAAALEPLATALHTMPAYLMGWSMEQPVNASEKPPDKAATRGFTDRLRAEIRRKGITQKEFLSEMGLNINAIGVWDKNGNIPDGETLRKIADYFGVSVEYLLGGEREPDKAPADWAAALEPLRKRMAELQRIRLDADNELHAMQAELRKLMMGGTGDSP